MARPHGGNKAANSPKNPVDAATTSSLRRALIGAGLSALVAGVTVAVFWPALDAGAVMPDDRQYVHANRLVRAPSWESAWRFLSEVLEPSSVGGYYQPLSMISLMLDVALGAGPDHYRAFHATSLALHAASAVLATLLLWSAFGNVWAAAAGALMLGLHPGAVESIAWVSDRKTLLAALFGLASLTTYLRYARATSSHHRSTWYASTALLFLLALMSKPTATTIPLAMIFLDLWPLQRFSRRSLFEKVPLLVLAAASSIITIVSQSRTADLVSATSYPWWATPLLLTHNIVFYLWKTLWPIHLSPYYPWPKPFNLTNPTVLIGLIGSLLLIAAVLRSLRRTRAWAVGLGVYYILLLPGMGILGFTSTIAADRFAYLPKIGLALLVVWVVQETWRKKISWRIVTVVASTAGCIGLMISTRAYAAKWHDTESFFRYQTAYAPDSAVLQVSLGNVLSGKGKTDEAIAAYRRAIEMDNDPNAHAALGIIFGQRGDMEQAITHLRQAVTLNSADTVSRSNLATILDHAGGEDEALREIEIALSGEPRDAPPYFHHAMMLFRRGRLNEAACRFEQALARDPDYFFARYQYGCLLMCLGKVKEGLHHWTTAYSLRSDWPDLARNLGWVWATAPEPSLRNPHAAIEILRQACERTSYEDPELLDALAAANAASANFPEAVRLARQSLVLWQARGDSLSSEAVRQRMRRYEQGQAYTEAVTPDAYRPR